MTTEDEKPTYESIWQTLSAVDCSEHVEKKMGLSYLSWAWAWGILMDHYPEAQYAFDDELQHKDGSMETRCLIKIGDCKRIMWLPVMDNRNNAIKNPDARAISDARMRCLVKTLALFGLGHYIYAGEDVPEAAQEKRNASSRPQLVALITLNKSFAGLKFDEGELVEMASKLGSKAKTWREITEDEAKVLQDALAKAHKAKVEQMNLAAEKAEQVASPDALVEKAKEMFNAEEVPA